MSVRPGLSSVLLAGGGSAGHVSPLLALADCLRRRDPDIRVTALGTEKGLEQRLVPARGYDLRTIPKVAFPRRPGGPLVRLPGALMAAIPGSGIDALMGTGGTPEGVMSACAIRAIGGEFLGRLDPQLQTEARAVKEAGIDTSKWYRCDEMIASNNVFFCATGITTGLMLEGVERTKSHYKVQTMMITGATGERQILTSYMPNERLGNIAARDVA